MVKTHEFGVAIRTLSDNGMLVIVFARRDSNNSLGRGNRRDAARVRRVASNPSLSQLVHFFPVHLKRLILPKGVRQKWTHPHKALSHEAVMADQLKLEDEILQGSNNSGKKVKYIQEMSTQKSIWPTRGNIGLRN